MQHSVSCPGRRNPPPLSAEAAVVRDLFSKDVPWKILPRPLIFWYRGRNFAHSAMAESIYKGTL